jgi:hypothetical protein
MSRKYKVPGEPWTCPKCKKVKPLTEEFWSRDRTEKCGFQSRCSPCSARMNAAYVRTPTGAANLKRRNDQKNPKNTARYRAFWTTPGAPSPFQPYKSSPKKRCATCHRWKVRAESNWYTNVMASDGLSQRCIKCKQKDTLARHAKRLKIANAIQAHRESLSPDEDRLLRRSIYDARVEGRAFTFGEYRLTPSDIRDLGWTLSWWREDIMDHRGT